MKVNGDKRCRASFDSSLLNLNARLSRLCKVAHGRSIDLRKKYSNYRYVTGVS